MSLDYARRDSRLKNVRIDFKSLDSREGNSLAEANKGLSLILGTKGSFFILADIDYDILQV